MGKLAERFEDADRSGVYRVAGAGIALEAAAQANARVHQIDLQEVEALAVQLRQLAEAGDRRPCVVLIKEGAQLAHAEGPQYAVLVEELRELARQRRLQALPFFALFVDPAGSLDLPPLYKERAQRAE